MAINEEHPDFVTAFARGLAVIRTFERGAEKQTLSQIASKTNLTRGSARRFILTLEALGYISQEDNYFKLTPKVLDLGYSYLVSAPIWEIAQPYMKQVVDKFDESCSLGVLDGSEVVYVGRVPPRHPYTIPVNVGTRMPAYANAMGRVLLASLPPKEADLIIEKIEINKITDSTIIKKDDIKSILNDVRKNGYAMPENQIYDGRRSIAVPIVNRHGETIASINMSAMNSRADRKKFLDEFLPSLQEISQKIGNTLA